MNLVGLKTYLSALLTAAFGVSEAFDWTTVLDKVDPALVPIVMAAVFAVLRSVTSTPPKMLNLTGK